MRLILFIATTIAFLTLNGCSNKVDNLIDNSRSEKEFSSKAKEYIENNSYLDFDMNDLSFKINSPQTKSAEYKDEIEKAKAAIYRFYSHVTIEDGYYKCSVKDASEINMSQNVFEVLNKDLESMNKIMSESRARGENFRMFVPDEKYLNSLLK